MLKKLGSNYCVNHSLIKQNFKNTKKTVTFNLKGFESSLLIAKGISKQLTVLILH